jgi:hypothetical protein
LQRLKKAVADYGAPAVALETAGAGAVAHAAPFIDADNEHFHDADAERSSKDLVERIAGLAPQGGAQVLVASADESAPACAGLKLARAMARQGRAILVQIEDADVFLRDALEQASGESEFDEPQPGLAQLLNGETSFAEAIYRDDASRLHIVQSGGPVETQDGDLEMILDALQATYDYVLIACGAAAASGPLAAQADLTVIFAEDRSARDFLHDDFAAAGARAIVLAGIDRRGEIIETAA